MVAIAPRSSDEILHYIIIHTCEQKKSLTSWYGESVPMSVWSVAMVTGWHRLDGKQGRDRERMKEI